MSSSLSYHSSDLPTFQFGMTSTWERVAELTWIVEVRPTGLLGVSF